LLSRKAQENQRGFTLLETAIVLVIVALIAGAGMSVANRAWKLLSDTYKRTVAIPENVVPFPKHTVH